MNLLNAPETNPLLTAKGYLCSYLKPVFNIVIARNVDTLHFSKSMHADHSSCSISVIVCLIGALYVEIAETFHGMEMNNITWLKSIYFNALLNGQGIF